MARRHPKPRDIAHVRHRQYLVDDVIAPSGVRDEHHLVRLTCLDDDAAGRALSVIWERELGARVARPGNAGLGRRATSTSRPRDVGARPLKHVLDELGLLAVVRERGAEALGRRISEVVSSEAFAAWAAG
jgi:hypothetical protein